MDNKNKEQGENLQKQKHEETSKSKLEQVGNVVGKKSGVFAKKMARHSKLDEKDTAHPDLNLAPDKFKKTKAEDGNEQQPEISGLEKGQLKHDLAGTTKSKENEIVKGEVIESGVAKYQFKKDNQESFYVKLKNLSDNKETIVWGKELQKNIKGDEIKQGDVISIEKLGKTPVTVNQPIKNKDGEIIDYKEINTHRNSFNVNKMSDEDIKAEQEQAKPQKTVKKTVQKSSEKEGVESQEQATDEKLSDIEKEESEKDVYALGKTGDENLGSGKEMKNMKDLLPTHPIGRQERELLANDQQVVTLDIDKKEWLKAKPDSNGNLHVSLYNANNPDDKFNRTVLKVPVAKVKMMEPDKDGRIKLMVAEEKPGHRKSAIQVYQDTPMNREKLVHKNPNVLSDTPELQKERVMNKPLKHGMWGYEMNVTMQDLKEKMNPENQQFLDKLDAEGIRQVKSDPEIQETYTFYEDMYNKRLQKEFENGMPIKLHLDEKYQDAHFIKMDKEEETYLVKDESNKLHTVPAEVVQKAKVSSENNEILKSYVTKDISNKLEGGNAIGRAAQKAIDTLYKKDDPVIGENIAKSRITSTSGINIDIEDPRTSLEIKEEIKEGVKHFPGRVDNNKEQKEEALKTPISEKREYKDFVEKMPVDQQGEIKSKPADQIKSEAQKDAPELRKNEHNVSEGSTIKKDGKKTDELSLNQQFSKAIVNNDKKSVKRLLEEGHKPADNHVQLMKEMKQNNNKVDQTIEISIKNAVPKPKQGMKV